MDHMACVDTPIEEFAAGSVCCWQVAAPSDRRVETQTNYLRLLSPADPLTRLMMEADGVSATDFDALLRKITLALASHQPRDPVETVSG
jgi:hypothetical protein